MPRIKSDAKLNEAVAKRLRVTREAMRLSQHEFACRAGIAPNTYNQFEQGKRLLTVSKAISICAAHGLTLDWIFLDDPSNLPYKLAAAIKALQALD
jgi:transcriptional regulator with XRE-family HTH domain